MKKLLVITLGHLSGGEFTIAFEFCKRLPKQDYDVFFLTSSKGEGYLKQNHIKHVILRQSDDAEILADDKLRNHKIAKDLIQNYKPDYILLSDAYTMWYSCSWTGVDFEMLKETNIPVGSFDSYEFSSTDYVQDYYGGYKAALPDFIDQCDFVIRYCPINKPYHADSRIKCTYLFERFPEVSKEEKERFYKNYQSEGNEKVIFLTNSDWESLNINRLPALSNLLDWTPKIIMNYIYEMDENITIIHVGPKSWEIDSLNSEKIKYFHYRFLPPAEFDFLLSMSDVFLTTNIISSTLAKAVYASVPSIVLQNDKLINFEKMSAGIKKMPKWYQEMAEDVKIAYPFRLFPFGWFWFLEKVLEHNPYTETFVPVNMFQKKKVKAILTKYLTNEEARIQLKEKQKEYVEQIMKLPSSKEVMESIKTER